MNCLLQAKQFEWRMKSFSPFTDDLLSWFQAGTIVLELTFSMQLTMMLLEEENSIGPGSKSCQSLEEG